MDPSQFYREKLYQGTPPTPLSPSMQYFSNVGIGMLEVARGQALETPFTESGIRGRQAGREIMKDIAWAETVGGSAMATYGSFGTKAQLAIIAGTGGAAAPALSYSLAGSLGTTAAGTLLAWHGTQVLRNAQELPEVTTSITKNVENQSSSKISSRNKLAPDFNAEGAHSVFKRDPVTGKVTHYETFTPQMNPYDPKPWKSIKRYDGSGKSHRNKMLKQDIETPHIHDSTYPGGIRMPEPWELIE